MTKKWKKTNKQTMNSEVYKDKFRKRRERMKEDKEKRLVKLIPQEKEHYVRESPRDLVSDYYLGKLNKEEESD